MGEIPASLRQGEDREIALTPGFILYYNEAWILLMVSYAAYPSIPRDVERDLADAC